ncbi:hypothetical protein QYM36_005193, partial [Artemia franciscana]
LNFKKGEVITVTQKEEGGWWEGTLNGKTGWFPANYVKEFKPTGGIISTSLPDNGQEVQSKQKSFQIIIMNDITESERNFIKECQNLVEQYLKPLEKCSLLPQVDYAQLVANYEEVIRIHNNMLHALEEMMGSKSGTPRFGRVFLSQAPHLKTVHIQYCSSHPKAITIVEKYRDELSKFMETRGATPPGILTLTTGLSRPFRRLERYATHLQELEKHLEESYPDRGDTQRSAVVYTDLAKLCAATRKERELALEVLSGNVRDWVGENPSALGDIIHLGMATIQPNNLERYFVLFPAQLIILTTSPRLSAFVFDKRIPLCDISANRIVSRSNAFELSGPGIEPITVTCTTKEEQTKWLDLLQQQIRFASKSMALLPVPQSQQPQRIVLQRVPSNHRSLPSLPPSNLSKRSSVVLPPKEELSAQSSSKPRKSLIFSPRPPIRTNKELSILRQQVKRDSEEDNQLLSDVIDSYFISSKNGLVPGIVAPPLLNPEDEKILVEEVDGETVVVKE